MNNIPDINILSVKYNFIQWTHEAKHPLDFSDTASQRLAWGFRAQIAS